MSEFKVIETQEELNKVIGERLNKAKESALAEALEKYADYDDLKAQNESYAEQVKTFTEQIESLKGNAEEIAKRDERIKELEGINAKHETDSVKTATALKYGIPYEMASRLSGTTKEEIEEDAKSMSAYFKNQTKPSAPASDPEAQDVVDGVTAAFRKLNPNLKF